MYISRIEIQHFRNFEHIVVETGHNLLLMGANATGKTNFIHALRLVLDPALSDRDRFLTADDFWRGDGLKPWDGREIKVSIDIRDFEKDLSLNTLLNSYCPPNQPGVARLTYIYRPKIKKDNSHGQIPLGITMASATDDSTVPSSDNDENTYEYILYGGDNEKITLQISRKNFSFRVINALRDAESDLTSRGSSFRKLLELYGVRGELLFDALKDDLEKADRALKRVDEIKRLQKDIDDRFDDLTEYIHDLNPTIGLLAVNSDSLARSLRLFIESGQPISSASLGLANVLLLALSVLEIEKREVPRKPLKGDEYQFTVLAIEEPEAHLHPHLQRILIRDFLKREPLILSTHSPHIASVAPVDSIVMFGMCQACETTGSRI